MLLALLGATAGQGVVWYTGQFYALFFLTITLKVDYVTAYILIGVSLLIGTPFFIFFGWLSDRIGRLKIILAGCLIAAVTYFPLFQGLDPLRQPGARGVLGEDTRSPWRRPTATSTSSSARGPSSRDCDKAKDFLTKPGLSFNSADRRSRGKVGGDDDRRHRAQGLGRGEVRATR